MEQSVLAVHRGVVTRIGAIPIIFAILCPMLLAQAQQDRIPDKVDLNRRTTLKGNINPHALPQFEQGLADPSVRLGRITLMLKPTDGQQADLERLLEQQQGPSSSNYRAWLTPEQYADRFGLSQSDLDKIVLWLQSQGFTIEDVARGRNWIAFSGSVAQVQAAFRTEIHRYNVDSEMHIANSGEPSVPADFAPVVLGVLGLDDFYPKSPTRTAIANRFHPDFTIGSNHYLAPDDLATIYDLWPLYNLGYFGTGQSIVVVGQSDFYMLDIANFRSMFNLPPNLPTKVPVPPVPPFDPNNPGFGEADLDLEWTGAIARNANLIYVYSQNYFDAANYAVNKNLAPIISDSISDCELGHSMLAAFLQQIVQQANAQGITWVASSGDSGAAGCNTQNDAYATKGLAVNVPASIPEVTSVGGTEFNEGSGPYWNPSNGAALSYIPEKAWNDTIPVGTLAASGGGKSIFFPKPAWQAGPGVPNDGFRDVPDLSLTASANHDGYLFCSNLTCPNGAIGGTSASTPVFAGILALLQQYQLAHSFQTTPGLGNINPTLYRLAQTVPNSFHDITMGNNKVPCSVGTQDCTTGSFGYNAGPGYDLVTGLGSVDAFNLITSWHTYAPSLVITKTHIGNFTQGQLNANYTVKVSDATGAGPTSGTVTVTETIPSGLMLVSMAGTGWNCVTNTCTRADVLNGGAAYPPITVTVNVLPNATSPQVNQVSVSGGGSPIANASDSTVVGTNQPTLSLSQKTLNFGVSGALTTSTQTIAVSFTNGFGVAWTASSNQPNITVSPTSGSGNGQFQVSAMVGSSGTITVTAIGATNSPQMISVSINSVSPAMPYGSFDTPVNNITGIAGAIPVTGWSLDNIEVTSLGIYREPIGNEATQPNGLVFIGNGTFVVGARPDVGATYPNAPLNYRAGWGYMLLTNFLPNNGGSPGPGNGTYQLHAIATNKAGQSFDLGTRTITVDNAHAAKPFGTVDTPSQGGTASGNAFVNFGWALTQNPYCIPSDGSTITVYIDSLPVGHPTYNQFRSDIATFFPGLCNTNGAVGFFYLDTTKLTNGVHTISWVVYDNQGRGDGIESRYFTVLNTGTGNAAASEEPIHLAQTVTLSRGFDASRRAELLTPKETGEYFVEIEELERIELQLAATAGYLRVNGEHRDLPVGSSLKGGVFHWQVGPGFLGDYALEFERADGTMVRARVKIQPKAFSNQPGR